MLRVTSGLKRSVVKWVSQVSVSIGATLAATLIYGALPRPAASAPPEMTSGGKFAARVEPASTVAYDGLDTMPLPRVATPATPAAFLIAPVPTATHGADPSDNGQISFGAQVHPALWDGSTAPTLLEDRGARPPKIAKPSSRPEPKHAAATTEPAPHRQLVSLAADGTQEDGVKSDDGLLPRVLSTARNAWTATASTSVSLLSRLIP